MRLASLLGPDLEEALKTNPAHAAELAEELHAADLAEIVADLSNETAIAMLGSLPEGVAAATLDVMDMQRRAELFALLDKTLAARLAESMSADERADLFQALSDELRTDLLGRLPKEESRDVRELIQYPETSAGGRMTTDYVVLSPDLTIEKAIEEVRRTAAEMETIYEAYAVDPNGTLLGAISLRALVLAPAGHTVAAVMNADAMSVPPEMDQEDVAKIFQHYGLLALPVVDATRKILGIVTVDDVVKVIQEEQAEDIEKLGAVKPLENSYFETTFWTFIKKRAGWLIALFLGEVFTASALSHYQWAMSSVSAIEVFIPLIISSGGNTGNQSSAIVIRGLALGEFSVGDAMKTVIREFRIGLVLGVILATIGIVRVLLFGPGSPQFSLAIGIALVCCVTFGAVVGSGLPFLIKRMGQDPAVSSGPFIASLVDVLGIVIYVKAVIFIMGLQAPVAAVVR